MYSKCSFRASLSPPSPTQQYRNHRAMRLSLRSLTRFVGSVGLLSFACLLVAIGTNFWYIIHVSEQILNSSVSHSSHTGLWRTCNFQSHVCSPLVNPFKNTGNVTHSENLRCTYLVLLPLSVIIMVVSAVLGIVNLLARVKWLLVVTGILLIFGALVTMCGVCVYVAYCAAVYREAIALLLSAGAADTKSLEDGVDIRFGWSLALACVSLVGEAFTGAAFLATAWRLSSQRTREDQGIEIK